jgi:hypothetical protein
MTLYGTCEKCGEKVETPQQPAFPVTGWEVVRSGGGANAIRDRKRIPGRVRHVTCLPDGNSEDQGSLLG